ncbi:MAG: carbonic anhydrase [Flavobacteriales bacterium]
MSPNTLGSLGFACNIIDYKLIVISGHTKCGTIKAICDDVQLVNMTKLLA